MAIQVSLRGDFKASQLRTLARKTMDGPQARRLLALAAIYEGVTRTEEAGIGGVTLQIIRDWSNGLMSGGCRSGTRTNFLTRNQFYTAGGRDPAFYDYSDTTEGVSIIRASGRRIPRLDLMRFRRRLKVLMA
jgi:hypothetical protein